MLNGILVVICIFGVLFLLSQLDEKRVEREKDTNQMLRGVVESFDRDDEWRSLFIRDALSHGMTIEFVDVEKNKVILKTPEGLVEGRVNRESLPHFLLEIKLSPKRIYSYTDAYININMNNQSVIIDTLKYA